MHRRRAGETLSETLRVRSRYDARCPSLVGFYGAFFQEGTIRIAIEFMNEGCLESVLKKHGEIPENVLAAFAFQVRLKYVFFALAPGADVEAARQKLQSSALRWRRELARRLNMRRTPQLVFLPDEHGIAADKLRDFLEKVGDD